jgi:hypothetical protein
MKKAAKITLIFIVFLNTIGLIIGCSHKPQPKSWVEVVRPPMRVTYIDFAKDIDPKDVHNLSLMMSKMRFYDYKFNDASSLHIDYSAKEDLTTISDHAIKFTKE